MRTEIRPRLLAQMSLFPAGVGLDSLDRLTAYALPAKQAYLGTYCKYPTAGFYGGTVELGLGSKLRHLSINLDLLCL